MIQVRGCRCMSTWRRSSILDPTMIVGSVDADGVRAVRVAVTALMGDYPTGEADAARRGHLQRLRQRVRGYGRNEEDIALPLCWQAFTASKRRDESDDDPWHQVGAGRR